MNNGDIFRPSAALAEVAMQVTVGLAMTIGLERLRLRTNSVVHDVGALLIFALTLVAIVFGLAFALNPHTYRPAGRRRCSSTWSCSAMAFLRCWLPSSRWSRVTADPSPIAPSLRPPRSVCPRCILGLEIRTLYHGAMLTRGRDERRRAIYLFGGLARCSECCCWLPASCCDRSRRGWLPQRSCARPSPKFSSSTWRA